MDIMVREQGLYQFGPFVLDPARRALSRDGIRIKLPERLFDALLYLVVNQGRLVARDELVQAVWSDRAVDESNLGQAIFALRKVLKASGGEDSYIVTVPSRGFRFAEPVRFEPWPVAPTQASAMPSDPPAALPWMQQRRMARLAAMLLVVVAIAGGILWRSGAPERAHPPAQEAAFAPPLHSVAVLAFDNLGGDPNQVYFSDGLSEQLIDSLTQIDTLQVVARVSAFSFRGSHATIGQIARALNVGAVLSGSVRRAGTHVVVTVELTNAASGFNMWSHTYDRDQDDIVDVQTDIALAVMRALHVASPGGETAKLTLGGTANAAAYDAYLRGIKLRREAKVEADYRAAIAAFDRALTLDPGFALAHARRAMALTALELGGTNTADEQQKLGQAAMQDADRAVALAPMLGFAHLARGVVLGHGLLNLQSKLNEMDKAEALSPGNATIAADVSSTELAMGHPDRALDAARRATQLDPLGPDEWGQLAKTLIVSHRYDEALAALDHERVVTGTLPERHMVLAAYARLLQGRPADARALCAADTSWRQTEILALADHDLGRQDAADADLAKLHAELQDGGAFNYAEIHAAWGQKQEALHWLAEAVRLRDPGLYDVVLDPFLDSIRSEPRFKEIVARLGAE